MTMDDSPWGWGGYLKNIVPVAGVCSLADQSAHINVKEGAAILFCLASFKNLLLGKVGILKVKTDSRVVMHVLNGFSSRSQALMMTELRKLRELLHTLNVRLDESWLPSVPNI